MAFFLQTKSTSAGLAEMLFSVKREIFFAKTIRYDNAINLCNSLIITILPPPRKYLLILTHICLNHKFYFGSQDLIFFAVRPFGRAIRIVERKLPKVSCIMFFFILTINTDCL